MARCRERTRNEYLGQKEYCLCNRIRVEVMDTILIGVTFTVLDTGVRLVASIV